MCRRTGWWPWARRDGAPRLRVFRGAPRHPVAARAGTGLFGPDALAWTLDSGQHVRDAGAADAAASGVRVALAPDRIAGLGVTAPGTPCTDDERTVGGADVVGHVVQPREMFRYAVLTQFRGDLDGDAPSAPSAVCIDVVFDDGARLSNLARDTHDVALRPLDQHDAAFLLPDQWVRVEVPLDAAAGRTVRTLELHAVALVPGRVAGFVDGI